MLSSFFAGPHGDNYENLCKPPSQIYKSSGAKKPGSSGRAASRPLYIRRRQRLVRKLLPQDRMDRRSADFLGTIFSVYRGWSGRLRRGGEASRAMSCTRKPRKRAVRALYMPLSQRSADVICRCSRRVSGAYSRSYRCRGDKLVARMAAEGRGRQCLPM
jgi:hypothetical protein